MTTKLKKKKSKLDKLHIVIDLDFADKDQKDQFMPQVSAFLLDLDDVIDNSHKNNKVNIVMETT